MKKYLIFLILILGCTSDAPEDLISEQKMESIIFDIMILNASYNYDLKIDNNLLSDELIYKKYDIDSLQFYESELYYSKNPKIHFNIYSNVKKRILKSIDSLKKIK
ncbi:DUF4296 domain-containing protein [Flavobacteriaceae bacterium]|jgi:hypothetical protein|nr:DUF4296 domain-containing protein [Flavobacteriaceae bacterium]